MSGRWIAAGSALLGVGALLAISWLVYSFQSDTNFWLWPGTTGVIVAGIGLGMLAIGFVMPGDESPARQVQHGGNKSINLQAGGDIHLGGDGSDK